MAEHEKLLAGSPFTGTTATASVGVSAFTTIRLVSLGGPVRVDLWDATNPPTKIYVLEADVGKPDQYVGSANRKLRFTKGMQVEFVAGNGELFCFYT